jgi:hypothetical protein
LIEAIRSGASLHLDGRAVRLICRNFDGNAFNRRRESDDPVPRPEVDRVRDDHAVAVGSELKRARVERQPVSGSFENDLANFKSFVELSGCEFDLNGECRTGQHNHGRDCAQPAVASQRHSGSLCAPNAGNSSHALLPAGIPGPAVDGRVIVIADRYRVNDFRHRFGHAGILMRPARAGLEWMGRTSSPEASPRQAPRFHSGQRRSAAPRGRNPIAGRRR